MIGGTITGLDAIDAIRAQLARFGTIDLRPLAERIAAIVQEGVRGELASGTSPAGASFAPLAVSTRHARHQGLMPGGGVGGSFWQDIRVRFTTGTNPAVFEINVGWEGTTARKVAYFDQGTRRQPARPIEGISDATRDKITQAINDFLRSLAQG